MALITKLNLVIAIFLGITFCEKENPGLDKKGLNTTDLDTFIINNYKQDATFLYFYEIISDSSHINFYNPNLDTLEINKILKIIHAVYDLHSPESNTVFKHPGIHGRYCYSFSSIDLKVKTGLPEIQNLANGVIPTGNTNLDNILIKYQFDSVETSHNYPGYLRLTIYTDNKYNLIPIEKEFGNLPQVILAEFNKACIGDGANIELSRDNGSAIITFSTGSGDCQAGCIYHKYWEFKVVNDKAEFIRTYGKDGTVKLNPM